MANWYDLNMNPYQQNDPLTTAMVNRFPSIRRVSSGSPDIDIPGDNPGGESPPGPGAPGPNDPNMPPPTYPQDPVPLPVMNGRVGTEPIGGAPKLELMEPPGEHSWQVGGNMGPGAGT